MLSVTCKAGIKAVVYLATKHDDMDRPGIREIARQIDENEHTVAKLLQTLVRSGIINSAKGPRGGFYITDDQLELPTLRVVDAIDGLDFFQTCGLGLSQCNDTRPCPLHKEFKVIREKLRNTLEKKTIKEINRHVMHGETFLS